MITSAETIAVGAALSLLDIAIVVLRFYVKRKSLRTIAFSDILIVLSLACACTTSALVIYGAATQGYGKISSAVVAGSGANTQASEELTVTRQLTWCIVWISPWTYGLAKISVLYFYRSIFVGRVFNVLSISLIVASFIWTTVCSFTVFFQCGGNIHAIWTDPAYVAKHCISGFADGTSAAAFDVFTDLLILMLPIYWVFKLQMSFRKRLSVIGVFLFGTLTVVSSIVRLVGVSLVYPSHNTTPNQYAYVTTLVYYAQLEAGLCIIAASLPTLGPLLFSRRPSHEAGQKVAYASNGPLVGHHGFGSTSKGSATPTTSSSTTDLAMAGSRYMSFATYQQLELGAYAGGTERIIEHMEDGILVTRSFNVKSEPIRHVHAISNTR